MHAAVPLGEFGDGWPPGVPVQFHTMDADEQGDADVARALAETIDGAELFRYPGDRHLFTDRSLPEHDPAAAALVVQRVLAFLAAVG
ncbi:dienelactone hydrolase family protein [Blastococcus saxobsidens]|nr:dienelactone hydrolase family protein [Blastococcus saxobsidens]